MKELHISPTVITLLCQLTRTPLPHATESSCPLIQHNPPIPSTPHVRPTPIRQNSQSKQEFASHERKRELFFDVTMSVDGAPPGDYVLAYILHDLRSGRTTRIEQPFKIAAPAAGTR